MWCGVGGYTGTYLGVVLIPTESPFCNCNLVLATSNGFATNVAMPLAKEALAISTPKEATMVSDGPQPFLLNR